MQITSFKKDASARSHVDLTVKKRSGKVVNFDQARIYTALHRCLVSELKYDESEAARISKLVGEQVYNIVCSSNKVVDVEEIQNLVETQLMANGLYLVAKQYILFREVKRQQRENAPLPEAVVAAFQENDTDFDNELQ